ncbi:Uncharacterized protein CG7065 [Eumeta japonica]|uniref:Uncharacterized protein CG7065 n=1 Tax=Eumeta variegata TaxID=151549 RepID=A0A4C1VNY8_EUMVA|nr:Uncharacterized protein CG7065 [Eumeta japonica]
MPVSVSAPAPVTPTPAMSVSSASAAASALQLLQTAYNENEKKAEMEAVAADPIDGLSDSDLETLLKNFNELSAEEQHSLIAYLKKLEAKDPRRVERLREYVDAAAANAPMPETTHAPLESEPSSLAANPPAPVATSDIASPPLEVSRISVTAKSDISKSPQMTQQTTTSGSLTTVNIDSDDDDYTVEEVLQSAKQNEIVNTKMTIEKKNALMNNPSINLKNFNFSTSLSSSADLLALVQAAVQAKPQNTAVSSATASINTNTKPISFGDVQEAPVLSAPPMIPVTPPVESRQFISVVPQRRYPAPQSLPAAYPPPSRPMPQWTPGPQTPPQFYPDTQARPWFEQGTNMNQNNVRPQLMNGRGPQALFRPRHDMNYGNNIYNPNNPGRGRGRGY